MSVLLVYLCATGIWNILGNNLQTFALYTGLLIPLFLLFFGYTLLRNTWIYMMWLFLGAFMLWLYWTLKDIPALQMPRTSSMVSFKSLFVFLLVFKVGTFFVTKLSGQEYVTPSKGPGNDIFEDRHPRFIDFIFFALFFFTIILAQDL